MNGDSRATRVSFAATGVAVVVILALWVLPGYLSATPNCPLRTTVSGRAYCAESVVVVPYECFPGEL